MLFKKFDFDNPENISLFKIDGSQYQATWDYYYDSYSYSLAQILDNGIKKNYALNCQSRPILFLIRHNFELCLKMNLEFNGFPIPLSHELIEIADKFNDQSILASGLRGLISQPIFNGDGSNFRYFEDKVTKRSFFNDEKIELADVVSKCNNIQSSSRFRFKPVSSPFAYTGRRETWDLTFHMGECRNLRHVRSQYDCSVESLIESVIIHGADINRVFLPLIFLIRHSLELGLKANIVEVQKNSSFIAKKDYSSEHSLARLYNTYSNYLEGVDLENTSPDTHVQYRGYKSSYDKLNKTIHDFDSNSRVFRYPVDRLSTPSSLRPENIDLIKLLELYYFTDPFITFTNSVLDSHGLLK